MAANNCIWTANPWEPNVFSRHSQVPGTLSDSQSLLCSLSLPVCLPLSLLLSLSLSLFLTLQLYLSVYPRAISVQCNSLKVCKQQQSVAQPLSLRSSDPSARGVGAEKKSAAGRSQITYSALGLTGPDGLSVGPDRRTDGPFTLWKYSLKFLCPLTTPRCQVMSQWRNIHISSKGLRTKNICFKVSENKFEH